MFFSCWKPYRNFHAMHIVFSLIYSHSNPIQPTTLLFISD